MIPYAIQQLIQYMAAFIFYIGVARFITQAEVGLWSILTASTAVFTTLTLFGLPVAAQKYVSENYGRGDLELLKKALPHQLEKTLNIIESFITYRTTQTDREDVTIEK